MYWCSFRREVCQDCERNLYNWLKLAWFCSQSGIPLRCLISHPLDTSAWESVQPPDNDYWSYPSARGRYYKSNLETDLHIGIGDVQLLGEAQFILLAPGFLLMFLSSLFMTKRESELRGMSAMALWKVPFLVVMTISNLGLLMTIGYISYRKGMRSAVFFFGISVVCMLAMAGMATTEQSIAQQWIEEIVNSLGQIAFAGGSRLLSKKISPAWFLWTIENGQGKLVAFCSPGNKAWLICSLSRIDLLYNNGVCMPMLP